MRGRDIPLVCQNVAELEIDLESRSVVRLCRGSKISAQEALRELRRRVHGCQNARCIDEGRIVDAVGANAGAEGLYCLVGLLLLLVKLAQVNIGGGRSACENSLLELRFSGRSILAFICDQRQQAVSLRWKVRLHAGGQSARLVQTAP